MAAQRFRGRHGAGGEPSEPPETRAGGQKKTPPGGFKAHGAVLFSRKRLIEASARTGAPLPPASRIHPRLPAADPPIRTHRARLPRGGASPQRAHRLGGHRRCLTACLGSSITPRVARPPRSRGRISSPPARSSILLHTHRAHPGARARQRPGADRTDPALRRPPDRWLITFTAAFCAGIEFQTMSQFYLISQFSSLMRAVTATPMAGAFFFFSPLK